MAETNEIERPANLETKTVSMTIKLLVTGISSIILLTVTFYGGYISILNKMDANHLDNVIRFERANLDKVISENSADKRTTSLETEIKEIEKRLDDLEKKNLK